MKRLLTVITIGVGVVIAGCGRDAPVGPDQPLFRSERAGSPALNVVSYNVYVGAGLEQLLMVQDPAQIPVAALAVWNQVMATDFSERAEAIADQIEAADAHVVGLQEISLFRRHPEWASDFVMSFPLPEANAEQVELDYLELLMDALEDRGLYYDVASKSANLDIELPMCMDPNPIVCLTEWDVADIRLTDYDVVLIRDDVDWDRRSVADGNYSAAMPVMIPGIEVPIHHKPSGWASVDIMFKGLPYRIVNTHLEPADMGGVVIEELLLLQAAQVAELLGIVETSPHPVIMIGDFNSDDDGSTTPTYQTVRNSGFVDAWLIGRPRGTGYTANQAPDLLNGMSELFHRIDFIFYRDDFTEAKGHFQGSVAVELLGEEQGDRTVSGLWPSDHAGVAATLRIAPSMRHSHRPLRTRR